MNRYMTAVLAAAMLASLPAPAQEGKTATGDAKSIRLIATDYNFSESRLHASPGQSLEVTLVNQGSHPHNVEFELPAGEVEFEQNVPAGQSRTLTFTAPDQTGQYIYYCPVANHRERGMEGTLVVQR